MEDWEAFEAELARRCRALERDEFFIVEGPPRMKERRAGLLGRRTRMETVNTFAQFLRLGNVLYAELVGGSHVGGDFPWSDAEDARLRELGWGEPYEKKAPMYAAYFPAEPVPETDLYLTGTLAQEAASQITHTFIEVAGVDSPNELRVHEG